MKMNLIESNTEQLLYKLPSIKNIHPQKIPNNLLQNSKLILNTNQQHPKLLAFQEKSPNYLQNICKQFNFTNKFGSQTPISSRASNEISKLNSFSNTQKLKPIQLSRNLSEEKQSLYFYPKPKSILNLKKQLANNSPYQKNSQEASKVTKNLSYACLENHQDSSIKQITIDKLDDFLQFTIPTLHPSRHSNQKFGLIECFAANTHQGLVRNYNEDRVSIILNITQPSDKILKQGENWPNCSFFAVYDGHGGKKCADFLRDNLHTFIINHNDFPSNPEKAIEAGCKQAEELFLQQAQTFQQMEKSGSCANFILIIDNLIYSCNIGDSRSIASFDKGQKIEQLTVDHKPDESTELKRIIQAGGKIYQSQGQKITGSKFHGAQIIGPYRVFPGRLSVSRAFGDIQAKLQMFDGNENVLIAKPAIKCLKIEDSLDYIIIACDGIYDRMSNQEVVDAIYSQQKKNSNNIHEFAAGAVENILMNSFKKKTLDNVTVVLIGFKAFKKNFQQQQTKTNNVNNHKNLVKTKKNPFFDIFKG